MCKKCKQTQKDWELCPKNKAYDLLKTGMVGGPSIVFCRYAEKGVIKIRPHIYGEEAKTCESVIGLDCKLPLPLLLRRQNAMWKRRIY